MFDDMTTRPVGDFDPRPWPFLISLCLGAYLATGHGYWGISHAPITGKMIAELISQGRVTCVDNPQDFDPNRFSD